MNEPVFDFSGTLSATINGPDLNFNGGDPYHMRLTLQQLPYDCPDPSFEFRDPSDVLERVFVTPYKPARFKENELRIDSEPLSIEVSSIEDVELFMPRYEFLTTEPTESEDQADTDTPPEGLTLLQGPRENESSSSNCSNLKLEVQHAVTHAWRFDALEFSVSELRDAPRQLVGAPGEAYTGVELRYLKALIVSTAQAQKKEAQTDSAAAIQCLTWQTYSLANDFPSELDEATLGYLLDDFFGSGDVAIRPFESSVLDRVLDNFYGTGDIATRPLESNEVDEGFFDSSDCGLSINTTCVTTPEKNHVTSGRVSTNDKSFQDSGIYMDDTFAEASLSDSFQKPSVLVPEENPEESIVKTSASCSAFHLNLAPPVMKRANAPRLRRFGGNSEYDWKSRREAPYDFEGFLSPKIDHNEGLNEFEPLETYVSSTSNDTAGPDARASHCSELFALCRSPRLFVLDDTPAQAITKAQYPELSNVAADAASPSSTVATTPIPPAVEIAELHREVPGHWHEAQQAITADNALQSMSEAAKTDHASFGALHATPSAAAAATQFYHPRATSVLKHKCLPGNSSLNVEDVEGNGADSYQEETHDSTDGSGSLDIGVPNSPAHEPSQELAFTQYVQESSMPSKLAPRSNSTASVNDSSAIHPEDLALTPQAEMASNPEHAALRKALDVASAAALNPPRGISTDPEESALTPEEKSPTTPLFSPLTSTEEEVDLLENTGQPSRSTNGVHNSGSALPCTVPNVISTHPANTSNGTHANTATPILLTPQPKGFWEPLYQLPSLLGTPRNDSLPTPSRQQSQLSINATTTPPFKPLSMPGQHLSQVHITTPKYFMPNIAPGTPTPAPKSGLDHQHRGVISFRGFKNPTHAKKFGKSVQNVFSSPQLGGKGYGGAEEVPDKVVQEPREPSSDATVVDEDADEAVDIVLTAVDRLKAMGLQKQSARHQTSHHEDAKSSVAEAVVITSRNRDSQMEEQQMSKTQSSVRLSAKESIVVPSKNKQTEEQQNNVEEPAKKKVRKAGTRRSARLSTQINEFFS